MPEAGPRFNNRGARITSKSIFSGNGELPYVLPKNGKMKWPIRTTAATPDQGQITTKKVRSRKPPPASKLRKIDVSDAAYRFGRFAREQ
jgi:hypothetical protein